MKKTTSFGLKERQSAPLALTSSAESLNAMNLINTQQSDGSKPDSHVRSGYNSHKRASMSGKHNVFVLSFEGKPLTPTTNARARKLLKGEQARPIWNKFRQFGIRMLVDTRQETPKTVLGCDFGTKFEGYTIVTDKENNLSVMWKLPNKKKLVKKMKEKRWLRRNRRYRNCRRRQCKSNNRKQRKGFIAPSQKMIVDSRLKCIKEFFKCYPINYVAIEDVRFNHARYRYGKNFSTIEIGKNFIKREIEKLGAMAFLYRGFDTQRFREEFGYEKSSKKDSEVFNSHCSDALALATDLTTKEYINQGKLIVVDDTYRCVRRRLHDSQFSKGGIRHPYSKGNFKSIRKGSICEFGQLCGGTKNYAYIRNQDNKRISKALRKIKWLSHNFKIKEVKSQFSHQMN